MHNTVNALNATEWLIHFKMVNLTCIIPQQKKKKKKKKGKAAASAVRVCEH